MYSHYEIYALVKKINYSYLTAEINNTDIMLSKGSQMQKNTVYLLKK